TWKTPSVCRRNRIPKWRWQSNCCRRPARCKTPRERRWCSVWNSSASRSGKRRSRSVPVRPTSLQPTSQIIILDAGGQYCHLIARKVRDLGVYAEVRPSETPAAELAGAKGIIISGGPSSVYDPGSPSVDPGLFLNGQPVLGICYGQQLMAHLLGGSVEKGSKG